MDLDAVEKLLCERYNVAELPSGALSDAMAAARAGDEDALRELVAERELYRWREPIEAALGEKPAAVARRTKASPVDPTT